MILKRILLGMACSLGALMLPLAAHAEEEPPLYLVLSNGVILDVAQKGLDTTLPVRDPDSVVQQGGMRFNVFYQDPNGTGFRAPNNVGLLRQTRYEEALAYVGQVLGATGTLDVLVAASTNVNNGTLALGGTFFQGINGYQNGTAFLRITAGPNKPSATNPEVFLQVNFSGNTPFHVGAGVPPGGQFDLQSVLLHEILHAMGFISLAEPDGSSPFADNNPPRFTYTVYDNLIRRNTGNVLLFPLDGAFLPTFVGTANDLRSNDLGFTGALATAQFGSVPPLFAPATFQVGSSVSHWSTGNIPGGAVMEHAFSPGEIIRQFPRFEAAAMRDLGWTNVNVNNLTRPPTAAFTVSSQTTGPGQNVTFTDLSFSGSQPVTSWNWNFGDGTSSTLPNPTKSYANPGTFNVSLTVTTAVSNDVETRNNFITVTQGPSANFTANPTAGTAPLQVQFSDTSNANGSPVTARQWNFGDGNSSTQQNPSHTYQTAGTFNVSLTVTTANGSDTETKNGLITVSAVTEPPAGCACSGAKLDENGLPTGDTLVTAAAMGLMLLVRFRRRQS